MATDRDLQRGGFERWYISRQRQRGFGAILADHEFVVRDQAGHYRTLGLDDALDAWCAALDSAPAANSVDRRINRRHAAQKLEEVLTLVRAQSYDEGFEAGKRVAPAAQPAQPAPQAGSGCPCGSGDDGLVCPRADGTLLCEPAAKVTMVPVPQDRATQDQLAESDRRAGAAERELAGLREDAVRLARVRDKMKEQWGASRLESFDVVWSQALEFQRQAHHLLDDLVTQTTDEHGLITYAAKNNLLFSNMIAALHRIGDAHAARAAQGEKGST